ncbi:hypothetical protein KW787_00320 [Candidatus Pacearchaeota archaeon]|nr:hypothetical protein [Candidatus Pacearchaeota archaeon]
MRKGLSDVVTTVLLLLVTIAAVAIVAAFIVPWIRGSLNEGTACVSYNSYFTFDQTFGYNCRDPGTGAYHISVRAEPNSSAAESIQGFDLVFLLKGATKVVHVRKGQESSCITNGISQKGLCSGTLKVPEAEELFTYSYYADSTYDAAEIYPVVKNGKVCGKSGSIELKACSSP